jgi:ubiquinone/menaquinone biosynthesis C-methylase UbiE
LRSQERISAEPAATTLRMTMDYDRETRNAYRSSARAESYRTYQKTAWSWGRVSTWCEQRAVLRLLHSSRIGGGNILLDVPCGTGVLASTVAPLACDVVASDISLEMMELATEAYGEQAETCFVQADITALPFSDGEFGAVVTLGFMHRVPSEIRRRALRELYRVSGRVALVSYSLKSPAQKVKHALLGAIRSNHVPAPCATGTHDAESEILSAGFAIHKRMPILPFLSSEWLYLLVKQ